MHFAYSLYTNIIKIAEEDTLIQNLSRCTLCPRRCGANRQKGVGLCGGGSLPVVARAALHHWEEPCISGTKGSGAVFFGGCPLGCVFCQNRAISRGEQGSPVSVEELAQIFLRLQSQGAHNINLVTAGHYRPWVQKALQQAGAAGLHLSVVWNSGGYETEEAVLALQNQVDVWLCDIKFYSPNISGRLANAPDYFTWASAAVQRMCAITGAPQHNKDGMLQRGVIVRLLVLPGHRQDAKEILYWMHRHLPKDGYLLSLMRQYTPPPGVVLPKPLGRRLSSYEYNDVADMALQLGMKGYFQEKESVGVQYVPAFDGTGVTKE